LSLFKMLAGISKIKQITGTKSETELQKLRL
jgi:hypothetical protein